MHRLSITYQSELLLLIILILQSSMAVLQAFNIATFLTHLLQLNNGQTHAQRQAEAQGNPPR